MIVFKGPVKTLLQVMDHKLGGIPNPDNGGEMKGDEKQIIETLCSGLVLLSEAHHLLAVQVEVKSLSFCPLQVEVLYPFQQLVQQQPPPLNLLDQCQVQGSPF